jgi:hypothetical protein
MKTICDFCGKKVRKQPAIMKNYKHVFCNRECFHRYQKEMWVYPTKKKKLSFFHRLKTKIQGLKGEQ